MYIYEITTPFLYSIVASPLIFFFVKSLLILRKELAKDNRVIYLLQIFLYYLLSQIEL